MEIPYYFTSNSIYIVEYTIWNCKNLQSKVFGV